MSPTNDNPNIPWSRSDDDEIVGRLRQLQWPDVSGELRERCWEEFSRRLADRPSPDRSPLTQLGDRYAFTRRRISESMRPVTGERLSISREWSHRATPRAAASAF